MDPRDHACDLETSPARFGGSPDERKRTYWLYRDCLNTATDDDECRDEIPCLL